MGCYDTCCQSCGPHFFYVNSLARVHKYAAAAHIVSALAILAAGVSVGPSRFRRSVTTSFNEPSVWRFYCRVGGTYVVGTQDCPTDNRYFYESPPGGSSTLYTVNTLWMAVAFATVSGVAHWVSACKPGGAPWTWKTESVVRFVGDYSVTAPIMLSLFSVLWGANNILSALMAPCLLAVLLWCAAYIIVHKRRAETTRAVIGLIVAYTVFLGFGIGKALIRNTEKPSDLQPDRGVMPTGVVVATAFVLATFSAFIVPYWFELKTFANDSVRFDALMDINLRDATAANVPPFVKTYSVRYAALSLIAKVTLHTMFGITAIDQAKHLPHDGVVPTGDPPDRGNETGRVFGAGAAIIVLGVLLYLRVNYAINHPQHSEH